MGYREFHISTSYKLFASFHYEVGGSTTLNPFLAAHRTIMAAVADSNSVERRTLDKFNLVSSLGVYAPTTDVDRFLSVTGHVVIPDNDDDAPHPLAVLIHGQSAIYKPDDAPTSETLSYRGYRYLQRYLAEKGVASVSVNVNFAGYMGEAGNSGFEELYRIEQALLMLSMLRQVAGNPVSTGQLIFLQKSDDSIIPLHEGLELEGSFSSRSPEGRLRSLKASLDGKLDFSRLGFMGHSRGGSAVQLVQPFFEPRSGTAPTDYAGNVATSFRDLTRTSGPYNSNTLISHLMGTSVRISQHLYHRMVDIVGQLGNPGVTALKTVIALQPADNLTLFNNNTTFFLAVASSHDNDVNEDSFNSMEDAGCPKAMIFSHGASHGRFNTVWRRLPDLRRSINRDVLGQSPIRMLSNRGHEELAKAVMGNAFLAGLLSENHRYGLYTGEIRATSIRQDIQRAWKFPFPFGSPPALRLLDGAAITAVDVDTTLDVPIRAVPNMVNEYVEGEIVFANRLPTKAFTRPANHTMLIRIPVATADGLVSKTHFSYRYTKKYNAKDETARRSVNLRNYVLRLKAGTTQVGVDIAGADVPSLHHPAYPTQKWSGEVGTSGGYFNATHIVMQTAEVPLSQFLSNGQPTTDLSRVTHIEVQLQPLSGGSGDETFYFIDFVLVTRNLPAAPSGFDIP